MRSARRACGAAGRLALACGVIARKAAGASAALARLGS